MTYLTTPCPYCRSQTVRQPLDRGSGHTFAKCATCGKSARASVTQQKSGGVHVALSANGRRGGGIVWIRTALRQDQIDALRKLPGSRSQKVQVAVDRYLIALSARF